MAKTIGVSEFVWNKLREIKRRRGLSSMTQTILYLVMRYENEENNKEREQVKS